MYKKTLYFVCLGEICQSYEKDNITVLLTREGGRIVRRFVNGNGKTYGARQVSYADGYFESETKAAEIVGDKIKLRQIST